MRIVIVSGKCFNIYRQRMLANLKSLLGERHEIEVIFPQKNLHRKLQEINPQILYMIGGGREHGEILEIFKGTGAVTVSDTLKEVDVYIDDEPEQVLPVLIEAIEQGRDFSEVPGITYKHKTKSAEKWNINTVNPTLTNDSFLTFSTRGCKGRCSFCNIKGNQGTLRFREVPDIIEDIKLFAESENYKGVFRFADCSFDSNSNKRMKKILKAKIRELPGHVFEANFRPDFHKMVDVELMELLFKAGNVEAFIGVESANAADLELYNKEVTLEDIEKTFSLFKSIDASISVGFININFLSTFESLRENVAFLRKHELGTLETLTKKLDLHDTPIKQRILKEGLLWGQSYYEFKEPKIRMLSSALMSIKNTLNAKAVELHSDISLKEVKRWKRYAVLTDDSEAFDITMKYEPKMAAVISVESDNICDWFSIILEMVEQLKDLSEIKEVSNRYINDDRMAQSLRYFTGLKKNMWRELDQLWLERNCKQIEGQLTEVTNKP